MSFVELDGSLVFLCRRPDRNVPRLRRRSIFGSFLREYNRYLPDASLRIMALTLLKISVHNQSFLRRKVPQPSHFVPPSVSRQSNELEWHSYPPSC